MSRTERDQLTHLKTAVALEAEISAFLIDREARGLSPRTIKFYRDELRHFYSWLESQGRYEEVTDVSSRDIRSWLLELGKTRNAGGIHANYRALRAFFHWTWEENEYSQPNPITKVKAPRVPKDPLEPLAAGTLQAMLSTCDRKSFVGARDRALMMALLDSGCRANEFLALNIDDIDLSSGSVTILHGKGNRRRVTFFGAKTRREVVKYLRFRGAMSTTSALWVTIHNTRLTYAGLRQIIRRRSDAAKVETPSLHSFRRAFALLSLRNGADVYSLQQIMGHSDLSVLRRYLKQTEADLQHVHKLTSPIDRLG